MTDPEIHLLSGAYAADALPADERAAFEEHLRDCPTCAQEVFELTATTARLATAASAQAPAPLRDRVLAEIQMVRQLPPSDRAAPADGNAARSWFRQPLGIAASLLLVLSLALGAVALGAHRDAEQAEQLAARIAAVATDPDRVALGQPISTGGNASVVAAGGNAVFRAQGLAVLPEDRGYQLWVMDEEGAARSVGVLGRGTSSHVERFVEDVGAGDSIGLTVEPSAGSDRPTTDPVLLMAMSA